MHHIVVVVVVVVVVVDAYFLIPVETFKNTEIFRTIFFLWTESPLGEKFVTKKNKTTNVSEKIQFGFFEGS